MKKNKYIPIVYNKNYKQAIEELRREWNTVILNGFDAIAEVKHCYNDEIRISYFNGNDVVIFAVDSKNLGKLRGRKYDLIYIEDTVNKEEISEFLTEKGVILWI